VNVDIGQPGVHVSFLRKGLNAATQQRRGDKAPTFSIESSEDLKLSLEEERDINPEEAFCSRFDACRCSHIMSFSLSCFCLPVSRSREIAGCTSIMTLDRTIAGGMATRMGMSCRVKIPAIIIPTPNCVMRVTALLNWGPHRGQMVCRLLIFK
jgi:hypothetical protein